MKAKRYKFLTADGRGPTSRQLYSLPHDGKPGDWMPRVDRLEICRSGYHSFTAQYPLEWLDARLFEVEVKGRGIGDGKKRAHHEMRLMRELTNWNERTARLFAADCAADVLPIFESAHPDDKRPRNAILAARAFARRTINEAMLDAARAAALAAARAAAGAAAGDAALAAAGDAAGAAALAAARAAALAAARAKYTFRFWEYVEHGESLEPWPMP